MRPRLTLLTFPFRVHTLTFHWAVWPRWTLASSRCSLTHSSGADEEAPARAVPVVLAADGDEDAAPEPDELAEGLGLAVLPGELDGLGGGVVRVETGPLGDGLEELGLGLAVPSAGSHCWLAAPPAADVCACTVCVRPTASDVPVWLEVAIVTMPKLDADTTRNPPAARLTAGRTFGKRMKALPCLFVAFGTSLQLARLKERYHHVRTACSLLNTEPAVRRSHPSVTQADAI